MWLILMGITAYTVVEAVKLEKRPNFELKDNGANSPDPASTLNRRS
jgi:hypothetical protein